ncbi:unnamed protein product [Arabidopsis halleri]
MAIMACNTSSFIENKLFRIQLRGSINQLRFKLEWIINLLSYRFSYIYIYTAYTVHVSLININPIIALS